MIINILPYRKNKRALDYPTFERLVRQGLNCKEIAREMKCDSKTFGFRMKKILGMYPSVYIERMKKL